MKSRRTKKVQSGSARGAVYIVAALLLGLGAWSCERGELSTAPESGDELRAVVSGAAAKDHDRIGHGMRNVYAETYIDATQGGTLQFAHGRLEVPAGSIDSSKIIWARTYTFSGRGASGNLLKNIYEFGPSGTTFMPGATLVLSYCNMGPLLPNSIDLMYFNEETGAWEIAGNMTHDPATRTFRGLIYHFSRYSLSGNGQTLLPQEE